MTPGNIHDSTQLKPMIERLKAKQMLPITLAIDSGYKTPFNAHFLLEK
ncbi:IS5/IS1182 family transposase, partial [Staphylococcus xylosus]